MGVLLLQMKQTNNRDNVDPDRERTNQRPKGRIVHCVLKYTLPVIEHRRPRPDPDTREQRGVSSKSL